MASDKTGAVHKGYNLGIYNVATNALGLSGVGGMAANWARHSKDLATVGEELANAVGTITASQSTLALSWDTGTADANPGPPSCAPPPGR